MRDLMAELPEAKVLAEYEAALAEARDSIVIIASERDEFREKLEAAEALLSRVEWVLRAVARADRRYDAEGMEIMVISEDTVTAAWAALDALGAKERRL